MSERENVMSERVLPTTGPLCLAWEIRMSDGQVFVPCVHGSCVEIDTLRQWRREEDADADAMNAELDARDLASSHAGSTMKATLCDAGIPHRPAECDKYETETTS